MAQKRQTSAALKAARREEGDPAIEEAFRFFVADADLFKRGSESFLHYHQRKLGRKAGADVSANGKRKRDEGTMLALSALGAGTGKAPVPDAPGSVHEPTQQTAKQIYEAAQLAKRTGAVDEDSEDEDVVHYSGRSGSARGSAGGSSSNATVAITPLSKAPSATAPGSGASLKSARSSNAATEEVLACTFPSEGGLAYLRVRVGGVLMAEAAQAALPQEYVPPPKGQPSKHRKECKLCAPSLLEGHHVGRTMSHGVGPAGASSADTDGGLGLGLDTILAKTDMRAAAVLIPRFRQLSSAELQGKRSSDGHEVEVEEEEEVEKDEEVGSGYRHGRTGPKGAGSTKKSTASGKKETAALSSARAGSKRGAAGGHGSVSASGHGRPRARSSGNDSDADDEDEGMERSELDVETEAEGEESSARVRGRPRRYSTDYGQGKGQGTSTPSAHRKGQGKRVAECSLDSYGFNADISKAFWTNYQGKRPLINSAPECITNVMRALKSEPMALALAASRGTRTSAAAVTGPLGAQTPTSYGVGAAQARGRPTPRSALGGADLYCAPSFGGLSGGTAAAGAGAHPAHSNAGVAYSGSGGAGTGLGAKGGLPVTLSDLRPVGQGTPLAEYKDDWRHEKWLIRKRMHYCETHAADVGDEEGEDGEDVSWIDEDFLQREPIAPLVFALIEADKKRRAGLHADDLNSIIHSVLRTPGGPGDTSSGGAGGGGPSASTLAWSILRRTGLKAQQDAERMSIETQTAQAMAMAVLTTPAQAIAPDAVKLDLVQPAPTPSGGSKAGGGPGGTAHKRARFADSAHESAASAEAGDIAKPLSNLPDVPFQPYELGSMMDVHDGDGCWWLAQVVDVEGAKDASVQAQGGGQRVTKIKVHFHGWPDESDDWLPAPSREVCEAIRGHREAVKSGKAAAYLSSLPLAVRKAMEASRMLPALTKSDVLANTCGMCKNTYTGSMIFCDTCGQGYHMECLLPPLARPPTGDWVCHKHVGGHGAKKTATTTVTPAKPPTGSAAKGKK